MNWKFWKTSYYSNSQDSSMMGTIARSLFGLAMLYLIGAALIGIWWSREPDLFDVAQTAATYAEEDGVDPKVVGYTMTTTFHHIARTLLEKPGGYLSNDRLPPGLWLDNMPNWEFGVLVQVRDMSRAMRIDFSRSQSQSSEDKDLQLAEGQYFFDNSSWIFPQTESEYRKGNALVRSYSRRLADDKDKNGQFYARADNLSNWLQGVGSRLGNLSQQLSASVGKRQFNLALAGDAQAKQSTPNKADGDIKTPWTKLDDQFFEARGQTWALIHLLRAVEVDFADVLKDKNAGVSLQQIVRELEGTQETLMSPIILNGEGLGLVANHSLVMASYISRANAGITDLRDLLNRG